VHTLEHEIQEQNSRKEALEAELTTLRREHELGESIVAGVKDMMDKNRNWDNPFGDGGLEQGLWGHPWGSGRLLHTPSRP